MYLSTSTSSADAALGAAAAVTAAIDAADPRSTNSLPAGSDCVAVLGTKADDAQVPRSTTATAARRVGKRCARWADIMQNKKACSRLGRYTENCGSSKTCGQTA